MTYNRKLDFYTLEGKSYVQKNQQIISANNANYNAEKEQIVFWDDVRLNDNSYFLKADSIFYDQVTEFATAVSSAHLFDTLSNNHLYGDKMEYYKKENKAFATDSPYGIHYMESDSLILSADTLSTYVDKQDTTRRVITGYNDVKYYLTDVQGIADSLSYVEQDSVLSIYGTPYVWSDSMQVSGDKLFIYLSTQDDIDSIRIVNNAFVINTADFIFFNQIKGKEMIADFLLGALQEVNVIGNGESLYFIQDEDDAYVGKNKSICGRMRIVLKDSQLEEMVFYNKPSAQLLPLGNSPMSIDNFLKGYNWDMSKRPKSFDSLKE